MVKKFIKKKNEKKRKEKLTLDGFKKNCKSDHVVIGLGCP
jgi:hypothetical protein